MKMRYFLSTCCLIAIFQFSIAKDTIKIKETSLTYQDYQERINSLETKVSRYENELLDETIKSVQQTNDRIDNYLTFTGIIATIFGVIIAVGGVFIGFESIRSQSRRDEAIKTLEEAKRYVENKKSDFDQAITKKIGELDIEYQNILILSKERLLEDINSETQKVKEIAQRKSQEIEDYSIEERTDEKMDSLQKRILFFENIGIPEDPKILLSKAKLLSEKKMHSEAIELLKKLIEIEPNSSDAYWQLGWENSKINHHQESIENYLKCIEFAPKNSSAHNNLGVQYENTNRPLDALKEFEKAIELNSKKKLYFDNKIRVLKNLNSNDEVIRTYIELIASDKTNPEIYRDFIKYLETIGSSEESIKYYDLAISEVKEFEQEFNFLRSLTLINLKRFDDAIKGFQKSIENNYKTEQSYLQIADIKFQQGLKDESIEILDSAINLNPKYTSLYAVKASYQIEDNSELAFNTILSGAQQIDGEEYFQIVGRYFAERSKMDFAKKLYQKANEIILSKIDQKKEGDLMNYYEGLILTDQFEEANKFIVENEKFIISDKYKIVKKYVELASRFVQGQSDNISIQIDEFITYVGKETFLKADWTFEDILFYLKPKINVKEYVIFQAIAELLKGQIDIEHFKIRIV